MRNEAIDIYHNIKIAHYTDLRNQIQVNGFFSSKEPPKHQESYELGKHATQDGSQLPSEEKKKVQIMFDQHNRVFPRSSTCVWIKSDIK